RHRQSGLRRQRSQCGAVRAPPGPRTAGGGCTCSRVERVRILHLLSSPFWSGPAENVALLAAAQRALGHEVTVAVDRKRVQVGSEEPIVPRLLEVAPGMLDEGGLELSVKSSPLASARDIALMRKRALDVVHSHFTHDHV